MKNFIVGLVNGFQEQVYIYLFAFLLALSPISKGHSSENIAYPDFTLSTLRQGKSLRNYDSKYIYDQKTAFQMPYLEIFRNIYAHNILRAQNRLKEHSYRIPRIVHQIWLGSEVPEKFYNWMKSWTNMQGWEYKLWTEKDVESLNLYNQEIYDLSNNYGEKSDILRLEILKKYGGLYVDVDFECIKPQIFDELHRSFDLYIGFEPMEHGFLNEYHMFKLCNALIGAIPHHPLIDNLIVNLKANYFAHRRSGTIAKTGPRYLSNMVFEYEQNNFHSLSLNMYLPSTFFYPFSKPEIIYYSKHPDEVLEILPETAAIHYWSTSWWKPKVKTKCVSKAGCESNPYLNPYGGICEDEDPYLSPYGGICEDEDPYLSPYGDTSINEDPYFYGRAQ